MDSHVHSDGWHNWSRSDAEVTVEYAKLDSRGPGAGGERVPWAMALTEDEATQYPEANVLGSVSGEE